MPSVDTTVRDLVMRRQQRRRTALVSVLAIVLVAVAGLVGFAVYQEQRPGALRPPGRVPAGTTPDRTGLAIASGRVRVDLYFDYLCPSCRSVESTLAPVLRTLVRDGAIDLVYHPLGHLDDYSNPSGYSTRAGSALGCAADSGRAAEYSAALFARQPPERSAGLSDDQLIRLGAEVGITAPSFAACVDGHTYVPWMEYLTETAYSRNISSTPTVIVAGERIDDVTPSKVGRLLSDAVNAAGGKAG